MPRPTEPADRAVTDRETDRLAVLTACACVLQVAESMLPHPIPGVRFGLANLITLIALIRIGAAAAIKITVLRTLVSSLVLGTFLGPSFLLSLSGGLVSTGVTILLYRMSLGRSPVRFSLVGISVAGSVVHVLTQVTIVYLLLVPNAGIWLLWPWLALSALVMGVLTGVIAMQVSRRLDAGAELDAERVGAVEQVSPQGQFVPGKSLLHRASPAVKIVAVAAIAIALVFVKSFLFHAAVLALLLAATLVARPRLSGLGRNFKRLASLLLVSLLIPVAFTPWGRVLFRLGPLTVTVEGVLFGALFASRLALMFLATALLAATTAPQDIAAGLERLLAPLRIVRVSPNRLATTLGLAWAYFPVLWDEARRLIGRRRRERWLDRLVHLPVDVVVDLYRLADSADEPSATGSG